LARLFELAARSLHSAGHAHGLYPAQWTALRYLAIAEPNDRTSSALARFQQIAIGPVTRTVRTLIAKGYVVKAGQASHHRSERLDVTDSGAALLAMDPLRHIDGPLETLSAHDKAEFARLLGEIIAKLQVDAARAGDAPVLDLAPQGGEDRDGRSRLAP
jgi:DNA-binding MarR family transcriptional regulator